MGINGIAADYYQAGYTNNKATQAEAEASVHIAKAGLYITPDGEHACFTQLAGQPAKSIDEQRMIMNERVFFFS